MRMKTSLDFATAAVGRLDADLDHLVSEKESAVSAFREMAKHLSAINQAINEKSELCASLIESMRRIREELEAQHGDNERIRRKIMDLLGDSDPVDMVLEDAAVAGGSADDFGPEVEE